MPKEFKLPDLGEGIHEAQVVNVLVKEGDIVQEDQMVLEVETDKAAVELPIPFAGVVASMNVSTGETITVGQVLMTVASEGDGTGVPSGQSKAPAAAIEPAGAAPARSQTAARAVEEVTQRVDAPGAEAPAQGPGPIPAAPAIRRLARELGIDLRRVHGTGPGGRIVREDVERFQIAGPPPRAASAKPGAPTSAPAVPRPSAPPPAGQVAPPQTAAPVDVGPLPDFEKWGSVRREKVPQIRKTIARQMARAWSIIPHVTHADEADITDLESFRKEHGQVFSEQGNKLTLTAFVIKAAAGALQQFPKLNASFDDQAFEIIYKDYVHIGVAVDTPRGLMVPVIRDVDRKGLVAVSAELRSIADRAREFKLDVADMRGGTFTITNVGALGGTLATPMINHPEVAILGMGKLSDKPVVRDGTIVPRRMLPLFISFDHRIIDGADGARFMQAIVTFLENPLNLLLVS